MGICVQSKEAMKGPLNPIKIIKALLYKRKFREGHPEYFDPCGTLIFTGAQGYGKTLSAVHYVTELAWLYPRSILVTNVDIRSDMFPEGYDIREYHGLDDLKNVENGYAGVIFFIDEIHLELNSLESKNIDVDIMTEISQQRKQRKHIVGTSQVYGRMAKPLREQIKDIVVCKCFFGCIQFNRLIDAFETVEKNGQIHTKTKKRFFWVHDPSLYGAYDTYAKMRRYKDEWQGRKQQLPEWMIGGLTS